MSHHARLLEFRDKARSALTRLASTADPAQPIAGMYVWDASQAALVVGPSRSPENYLLDHILIVNGDLAIGAGSTFRQPVFVAGNCSIGKDARLEALCAEGDVTAEPGCLVESWVHCAGRLDLRATARVRGLASAYGSIRLSTAASAGELHSLLIETPGDSVDALVRRPLRPSVEIPPPSECRNIGAMARAAGMAPDRISAAGSETWIYDGDVRWTVPVYLRAKLAVTGAFECPAHCVIEDDIRAIGDLSVGEGSIIQGMLTAGGKLTLDQQCWFSARLDGAEVCLGTGCRGFHQDSPVEVESTGVVSLEPGVQIHGRLSAGKFVRAEAAQVLWTPLASVAGA